MQRQVYKARFKKQLEELLKKTMEAARAQAGERERIKQSLEKDKQLVQRLRERNRKEMRRLLGKVEPFEELTD